MQALSPVGRCKSFDNMADGYGRGEGFVAMELSRARAIVHCPSPLAIVLATAINQDGRSSGLTAPNGPAQSKLVGNAMAEGELRPSNISTIAVHGTGKMHSY